MQLYYWYLTLSFLDSGDVRLFETLHRGLESGLPSEAIEWKRSFGRASKNVQVSIRLSQYFLRMFFKVRQFLLFKVIIRNLQITQLF